MRALMVLMALSAAVVFWPGTAHGEPCILRVGEAAAQCGAPGQVRSISPRRDAGVTVLRPGASASRACRKTAHRIPDYDNPAQSIRYELCISPLAGASDAEIAESYAAITRTVNRVCRRNGIVSAKPRRYCVRDTLYRAVVDVNSPALNAFYTAKTGRTIPRVELDPARAY